MEPMAIKATGSQITFCDTKEITRKAAAMAIILQRYIRLFREVWPQDYPPLGILEFCYPSQILTLYSEATEIGYWVLEDTTVEHLESQCKEVLIKIIKGELI